MNPPGLATLLDQLQELPTLPAAVDELIRSLRRDDVETSVIVHGIAHDQALCARVLRVANSPFYGVPQGVASIHNAVVVLGFRTVGSLVMAASVTGYFQPPAESGLDLERFWRHCIRTALTARALARRAGLDPEAAFTAGLLHDIGRLLVASVQPLWHARVEAEVRAGKGSWLEVEQRLLGFDHSQAGAALAARWRFPPEMVAAVELHHSPVPGNKPDITDVVHAANALAHLLATDAVDERLDPGVRALLGLDFKTEMAVLGEGDQDYESYCSLLVE